MRTLREFRDAETDCATAIIAKVETEVIIEVIGLREFTIDDQFEVVERKPGMHQLILFYLLLNDLSEKQKEWNKQMDEQIEDLKIELQDWKNILERDEQSVIWWRNQGEEYKDLYKHYRNDVKMDKDMIRRLKIEIANRKSCKYV